MVLTLAWRTGLSLAFFKAVLYLLIFNRWRNKVDRLAEAREMRSVPGSSGPVRLARISAEPRRWIRTIITYSGLHRRAPAVRRALSEKSEFQHFFLLWKGTGGDTCVSKRRRNVCLFDTLPLDVSSSHRYTSIRVHHVIGTGSTWQYLAHRYRE